MRHSRPIAALLLVLGIALVASRALATDFTGRVVGVSDALPKKLGSWLKNFVSSRGSKLHGLWPTMRRPSACPPCCVTTEDFGGRESRAGEKELTIAGTMQTPQDSPLMANPAGETEGVGAHQTTGTKLVVNVGGRIRFPSADNRLTQWRRDIARCRSGPKDAVGLAVVLLRSGSAQCNGSQQCPNQKPYRSCHNGVSLLPRAELTEL